MHTSPEGSNLPGLVPELLVVSLDRSLAFWRDLIGFAVLYDRPDERFALLTLGTAAVMLEERQPGMRQWLAGAFAPPLGVGINLQIAIPATAPILDRLRDTRWTLFMDPEENWYRAGRSTWASASSSCRIPTATCSGRPRAWARGYAEP